MQADKYLVIHFSIHNNMKFFSYLSIKVVIFGVVLTSCNKDDFKLTVS